MRVKLKNIADISSGITFRSRPMPHPDGEIRVIQMKDLGKNSLVNLETPTRVESFKHHRSQLVQAGDIVFRSRGQVTTAALIDSKCEGVVLAAPLFKIRIRNSKVFPHYLLWAINQHDSQLYFGSQSEGTSVKMVSKQSLGELEINLPSLEKQRVIAKVVTLSLREQELLDELKKKRLSVIQGQLKNILMEEKNDN